jgi:hypothetical protein
MRAPQQIFGCSIQGEREAKSVSTSQGIHCTLQHMKVHYHVHIYPPPAPITSQSNPLHTHTHTHIYIYIYIYTHTPYHFFRVLRIKVLNDCMRFLLIPKAQWLRHCTTSQMVPGSIPGGVTGFFRDIFFLPTVPWPWGRPIP